jgi:hypothetical protein
VKPRLAAGPRGEEGLLWRDVYCWKIWRIGVDLLFEMQTNFVELMTMQVLLGFPLSATEKAP